MKIISIENYATFFVVIEKIFVFLHPKTTQQNNTLAVVKHHGNTCDFTPQRNRELVQAYRRVVCSKGHIVLTEVCREVSESPCSRFWVSEERATAVMSELLKGRYALDSMGQQKRDMFVEIFKRVRVELDGGCNERLFDVVFRVVNSPAPKFYMTPQSVLQILWRIKRGHYNNKKH